jgi:tRNA-splicing ligase RtcB
MDMIIDNSERIPILLWLDSLADIEAGALEQARHLAQLPFAFKQVAIMPDVHVGYGMPIGGVLASQDAVIPNAVGVDIGCGMIAVKSSLPGLETALLKEILAEIRTSIPVGFEHHKTKQSWDGFQRAPDTGIVQRELQAAMTQLGTLGGGNHFIEIQQDGGGSIWVMIHSGSRNVGLKVANHYHHTAKDLCQMKHIDLPDSDLAFLPLNSPQADDYLASMNFCLDFARANRESMLARVMEIIIKQTGAHFERPVNIHHNYAALERHFGREVLVHRKGATRATAGRTGIIPGSQGANSYIVEGLGNPDSFLSSSHGAGRRMGRKEAVRSLDLAEEQSRLRHVIHSLRTAKDLDEAPGAYKDIEAVMRSQSDLVKPLVTLTPLAVVKG